MITDYLKILKIGHLSIVDALDGIQPFLRSYSEARPRLRGLHQRLLTFFSREDKDLFDELYRFYKGDKKKTKMIDFLYHDLNDAKIKYLIFFEKHSGEALANHAASFPREFSMFLDDILARFKIEEEYLFPLLEKMQ